MLFVFFGPSPDKMQGINSNEKDDDLDPVRDFKKNHCIGEGRDNHTSGQNFGTTRNDSIGFPIFNHFSKDFVAN